MKSILMIALCLLLGSASHATADQTIGSTAQYPGFSALDILNYGGFINGIYWIDPDLGSFSNAVQAYCDMTTQGGGWTLLRARDPNRPDVSLTVASNIINPSAGFESKLHLIGSSFDVFITNNLSGLISGSYVFASGNYNNFLNEFINPYHVPNPYHWFQLYNIIAASSDRFDLYIREAKPLHSEAPVPLPGALVLLVAGLTRLAAFARRAARPAE